MGALRAAELQAFGMTGIGQIFSQYVSGFLEDDDEVAVAHASAAQNYAPFSEAMVDIRFNVNRAVEDGVINPQTAHFLVAAGKSLFYPQRNWDVIATNAASAGADLHHIDRFRNWMEYHGSSLKAKDAVELLETLSGWRLEGHAGKVVDYVLNRTSYWEYLRRSNACIASAIEGHPALVLDEIIDEIRLCGPMAYQILRDGALLRFHCVEDAVRHGVREYARDCHAPGTSVERNVGGSKSVGDQTFVRRQSQIEWSRQTTAMFARSHVVDYLLSIQALDLVVSRLETKSRLLNEAQLENPGYCDIDLNQGQLLDWYFCNRLRIAVPASLDEYAQRSGFDDVPHFLKAILRERAFEDRCKLRNVNPTRLNEKILMGAAAQD